MKPVVGIILFFFAPFAVLVVKSFIANSEFNFIFGLSEFARIFFNSFLQATLSSVGSLFFGFLGALGLLSIKSKNKKKIVEIILMLPGLLPTLFVIVACLNLVSAVGSFPFGIWGVVLVHVYMNMGLVAVAIGRLLESQMGGMIELAIIEGASRFQILMAIVKEFWSDLFAMGFLVFILSFTSFSVPLIVGANYGETLEVLIYRIVMSGGDLKLALFIAIVQMIFLAVFSVFVLRKPAPLQIEYARNYSRVASRVFLFAIIILTGALLAASTSGVSTGLTQLQELLGQNPNALRGLLQQAYGTFIECVGVAVFCILFFSVIILLHSQPLIHRFLLGYAAPSVVVVGLGFYLMFNIQEASRGFTFFCLIIAFSLTILPTLYRLRMGSVFSTLSGQVKVAKIMGANVWQISWTILWPQMYRDIFFVAGIGAFWASGDFALASIIAGREVTLGIVAKGLLGGYRLELATLLTWASLLIGVFVFIIFEGVGRVFDSKFNS